jgi:hypothetical protein
LPVPAWETSGPQINASLRSLEEKAKSHRLQVETATRGLNERISRLNRDQAVAEEMVASKVTKCSEDGAALLMRRTEQERAQRKLEMEVRDLARSVEEAAERIRGEMAEELQRIKGEFGRACEDGRRSSD